MSLLGNYNFYLQPFQSCANEWSQVSRLVNLQPFFASTLTRWFIIGASLFCAGGKNWYVSHQAKVLPFVSDAAKSTRTFKENKSTPRLSAALLNIYIGTKGVMGTQTRGIAQVAFLSNILVPVDCVSSLQTWRHDAAGLRCSRKVYTRGSVLHAFCVSLCMYMLSSAAAGSKVNTRDAKQTGKGIKIAQAEIYH
jgi:hypothetical protein